MSINPSGDAPVASFETRSADLDFSLSSDLLRSSAATPMAVPKPPPSAPPMLQEQDVPGSVETTPPAVRPNSVTKPPPHVLPPLHSNAVHPAGNEDPAAFGWQDPARNPSQQYTIEDIVNTLECPVCLDTADTTPIYQCPEGHLLCEDCNSRLVDCPQCGHALMNSRNRIAEDLAARLQMLRGDRRDGLLPSQAIEVNVSEPQKVRKGFFAHVIYHIDSKIGQQTDRTQKFSVTRRYQDVQTLHDYLVFTHQKNGVIVPPPPEKNRLAAVQVKMSSDDDLQKSSASLAIGRRCVALDRYIKRLARHPAIRKDPNFRSFIQEKEIPKSMKVKRSIGSRIDDFKESFQVFKSKYTVSERDPWFQTRQAQLKELNKQLKEMNSNLKDMAEQKHKLYLSTLDFRRGLVMLLVSRPRENKLSDIINQVVDCHKTMGIIHQNQSQADEHIVELSTDYLNLVETAKDVLTLRRRLQSAVQKTQKNKGSLEDIDKVQAVFDKFSQNVRRELEHFDTVMREEFESAFTAYNTSYWESIHKKRSVEKDMREMDGQED